MAAVDLVASVRARIGAIIEAEVQGVTVVYGYRPKQIASLNLPAMLITVDASSYNNEEMDDMVSVPRVFHPTLLVATWSTGIEFEVEARCEPFFGQMMDAFIRRPSLDLPRGENPLQFVQDARLTGDGGIVNISLAGLNYAGIVWDLAVLEYTFKNRP